MWLSGQVKSNSIRGMKGELESIKAKQEQKNGQLTEELNQWKEGFKTTFEEKFTTLSESIPSKFMSEVKAQCDKRLVMAEQERTNERLKTLEERQADEMSRLESKSADEMSRLESKQNRQAFGLAVTFIAVFLIQAKWTSLTHGFDDLVSKADPYIETLKSYAASVQDFVVLMMASARKIRIIIKE